MPAQIEIRKIKHIEKLVFDIPNPGVHVIAGSNGAGKSCLLTCLLRIGRPNAFQTGFRTSKVEKALDAYDGGNITYRVNDKQVTYAYSGERWSPTPRSNSKLLEDFGYPAVIYAAANADRIEPREEDFKVKKVRDAPPELCKAAAKILGDKRFENLKVVNIAQQGYSEAFLMPDQQQNKVKSYYSEKNFSLGEICVLKLLRQLQTCPRNSLVLIDELELALHPRAQVQLLKHLEQISEEKTLTVIFSTHSSNLIKCVPRKRFYFLERGDKETNVISECFPAYALGAMALQEENLPDVIIYVEDEQAKLIVNCLVQTVCAQRLHLKAKPTVLIVPIGPFSAVVNFLTNSKAVFPDSVKQYALLDKDVEEETLKELAKKHNHSELQKIKKVSGALQYLPWTPEVGICKMIISDVAGHERAMKNRFGDQRIRIQQVDFDTLPNDSGPAQRQKAKILVRDTITAISETSMRSEAYVREQLSDYFAESCMLGDAGIPITKLLMPLLR